MSLFNLTSFNSTLATQYPTNVHTKSLGHALSNHKFLNAQAFEQTVTKQKTHTLLGFAQHFEGKLNCINFYMIITIARHLLYFLIGIKSTALFTTSSANQAGVKYSPKLCLTSLGIISIYKSLKISIVKYS